MQRRAHFRVAYLPGVPAPTRRSPARDRSLAAAGLKPHDPVRQAFQRTYVFLILSFLSGAV